MNVQVEAMLLSSTEEEGHQLNLYQTKQIVHVCKNCY